MATSSAPAEPPEPVVPLSEWGRRLSDAVREALDAGALGRARRLVLEGDGQARSLDKEYAFMARGLGITIRLLLGLLAELPPRPDLGPLLERFGNDLARWAAGAPAALASEPAEGSAALLARTRRLLDAAETLLDREQARLAGEAVLALDAGDGARARARVDDKEGRWLSFHDRLVRFMAEVFAYVHDGFGPEALRRFHRATAEGQRAGFEKWERMSPAAFAWTSAFLFKQHMGRVEVREDDDKFVIEQAPCGSGGRLRLAGAYSGPGRLPMVDGPGALTIGEARLPVYCSHCPIWNGVAPIEWFGRPHWVFERPSRPDGACTVLIYKRRDGAPPEYFRRLGMATGSGARGEGDR